MTAKESKIARMTETPVAERRTTLKMVGGVLAAAIGLAIVVPAAILLRGPLRRRGRPVGSQRIPVASLTDVPDLTTGAAPLRVPVVASRVDDAWNRQDDVKLGAVFLGQRAGGEVLCLSAICPHAGCGVDFDVQRQQFICPCHKSTFSPEGHHMDGPAPRDMDRMETTVQDGRVYCTYQRFRPAIAQKVSL